MIKQISVGLMLSLSTMAYADDHASSTPGPVETWNCVLNEGKTLDDVRKVAQMVSEVDDADSNPVAQWVFTLYWRYGERAIRFNDRLAQLSRYGESIR